MQHLLLDVWARLRTIIVFVTHDIDEAIVLGDRVLMMTSRPGSIGWERRIGIVRPRSLESTISREFLETKRECAGRLRSSGLEGRDATLVHGEGSVDPARPLAIESAIESAMESVGQPIGS
jgi:ABC-type sulfate/molybdate transport systems ATPase subunit